MALLLPLPAGLQGKLVCPQCREPFRQLGNCSQCGHPVAELNGVLDFLGESRREAAATEVNDFYEVRPFPGYAAGDNAATLLDRCRSSPFMVALNEAIPADATIADCGCGTGQIPNYLALAGPRRHVVGVDACRASLREAEGFRHKAAIDNLRFVRGDLFAMPYLEGAFDVVMSRGVVHHTPEPWKAIQSVAKVVKPGGFLVLSFYESAGRFWHRCRQFMQRHGRSSWRRLDPILRRGDLDDEKKRTWIEDQYHHPLEHCLPFPRVVKEVEALGFDWVRSLPPATGLAGMFEPTPKPSSPAMALRRFGWTLAGLRDQDAGMACLVARRQSG
ncbi:MAG: class I SAM-dependent methyltransferase [Planctomycetota bacterium]|nr:MAG: class I SAM-dependent methyltransferase [Planctomycetota bacterium]